MRLSTLLLTLGLAVSMTSGAFAQDKMSDSKMSDHMGKMDDKSMDQHMYDGLTSDETKLAHHLFNHLSKGDRSFLKKQIHERGMKSSKMDDDKMGGGKMDGDKMSGDKMGMDKMAMAETRYNKIYKDLTDPEKVVVDKLIANCAKWCKDHSGKM
jgi:hypothetical protein